MFPEGTSTDGSGVAPFKSSLFSLAEHPALRDRLTVQPLSIAYTRARDGTPLVGSLRSLYAWFGEGSLAPHLARVLGTPGGEVELRFLAPIPATAAASRKLLARQAEAAVKSGIDASFAPYVAAQTSLPTRGRNRGRGGRRSPIEESAQPLPELVDRHRHAVALRNARRPSRCRRARPAPAAPTWWMEPRRPPRSRVPSAATRAAIRPWRSVSRSPACSRPRSTSQPKGMRGASRGLGVASEVSASAAATAARRSSAEADVGGLALDAEPAPAEPLGDGAGGAGAEERIEDHVARVGRGEDHPVQQRLRLLRRMRPPALALQPLAAGAQRDQPVASASAGLRSAPSSPSG